MRKLYYILLAILALAIITAPIAAAKRVGPYNVYIGDAEGNPLTEVKPGTVVRIWVENPQLEDMRITLRVVIADPKGVAVAELGPEEKYVSRESKVSFFAWQVPDNAPHGKWSVTVELSDEAGRRFTDTIYFNVVAAVAAPAATPTPAQQLLGLPTWAWVAIAAAAVAIVAIAVVAYVALRAKPARKVEAAPAPAPAPAAPPSPPGGAETVAVPAAQQPTQPGGGETIVALARLIAPDGTVIPITSSHQAFGREDFEHLLPPDKARLISRRSRPQFVIFYDFSKGQFFIEDRNSANGTYLNGKQIKGAGPQPLKDGDVISPAGVINLTFKLG